MPMSMRPSITEQTRSVPSVSGEYSSVVLHSYSRPAENAVAIQSMSKINAILKHTISLRLCYQNNRFVWCALIWRPLTRGHILILTLLLQQVEIGQLPCQLLQLVQLP